MKKSFVLLVLAVVLFLLPINMVFAQRGNVRSDTVTIRLASPLPRNSDWGRALDQLAADWERVTGGAVRVVVNHDGREGSEGRMLSSLRSDAIQAAIFTSAGVSEICPEVMTLSVPFLINTDAELDMVLREVKPILDSRVHNDFVVVAWSKGGWVYIFSKEQVLTPNDLRRQRFASTPELKDINTVFTQMGFNTVEADLTVLGTRLATNVVNATYMIPAAIAPLQLHRSLGHMLDLPIAPVMGAIVMNRVTWNKLTPQHREEILRASQRIAENFDATVPRTEANAIASMGRDGLAVNKLTPAQIDLWRAEVDNVMPSLIGTVFDRELYRRINTILERARR